MKKIIASIVLISASVVAMAQPRYDTLAVLILDRMAKVIGDLESCTFRLKVADDVMDTGEPVKYFTDYKVYLSGPNKMLIDAYGYKGHRQFRYDGKQFAYYSYDENNYGILPTPGNTIETIDNLHADYGIDFPAADFFYPTFTDDLMEHSDSLRYLGIVDLGGREFYNMMAYSKEMNVQLWINADAYSLPGMFTITYKNKESSSQYMGLFSEWQVNPSLPVSMFDFLPPPNAAKVRILSKAEAN